MYKLDLPIDSKESAAMQRRRNQEIQRKSRIFDARNRIIGVNMQALEEQVKEKQNRNTVEADRHNDFASLMVRNDKIGLLQQERENQARRMLNAELNEYRRNFQQPQTRKEWDLNDPKALQNETPLDQYDGEANVGISSVQILAGEDSQYEKRKKLQAEQLREWIQEQMNEKEHRESEDSSANKLHYIKACDDDRKAIELEDAEKQCRKNINAAVRDYNIALTRERREAQQLSKRQELEDNFTELGNQMHGDFLTENTAAAISAYGSHRVITDRWKGMTNDELRSIYKIQEQQRTEKEAANVMEKHNNSEWAANNRNIARIATLMENDQEKRKRELAIKIKEENCRLAKEQQAMKDQLNNVTYRNQLTEDFFSQFGTGSR